MELELCSSWYSSPPIQRYTIPSNLQVFYFKKENVLISQISIVESIIKPQLDEGKFVHKLFYLADAKMLKEMELGKELGFGVEVVFYLMGQWTAGFGGKFQNVSERLRRMKSGKCPAMGF